MKPNIKKTIWAERHAPNNKASLELRTCKNAETVILWHKDIYNGTHVKNCSIILTSSEFDNIAETLGYRRVKFDSMKEVLSDKEINLIKE